MSDKRQNNQLRLSFGEELRSEAPQAPGEGSETLTAKRISESPANYRVRFVNELLEERALSRPRAPKNYSASIGTIQKGDLSLRYR
jgi:hypothetical protein